jgi:hypothetical protein
VRGEIRYLELDLASALVGEPTVLMAGQGRSQEEARAAGARI